MCRRTCSCIRTPGDLPPLPVQFSPVGFGYALNVVYAHRLIQRLQFLVQEPHAYHPRPAMDSIYHTPVCPGKAGWVLTRRQGIADDVTNGNGAKDFRVHTASLHDSGTFSPRIWRAGAT